MLKLSKNRIFFGVLVFIYSLVFNHFYGLHVTADQWLNVARVAAIYGCSIFITGLILGIKDPVKDSRFDQGFQYHLVTFIVVNITHLLWPLVVHSEIESSVQIGVLARVLSVAAWGVGLLVHYLLTRKTIKGIPRDKVFD